MVHQSSFCVFPTTSFLDAKKEMIMLMIYAMYVDTGGIRVFSLLQESKFKAVAFVFQTQKQNERLRLCSARLLVACWDLPFCSSSMLPSIYVGK